MAKNDNLRDFLVDLANVYKETTGDYTPINPQDFSTKFREIASGGGGSSVINGEEFYGKVARFNPINQGDFIEFPNKVYENYSMISPELLISSDNNGMEIKLSILSKPCLLSDRLGVVVHRIDSTYDLYVSVFKIESGSIEPVTLNYPLGVTIAYATGYLFVERLSDNKFIVQNTVAKDSSSYGIAMTCVTVDETGYVYVRTSVSGAMTRPYPLGLKVLNDHLIVSMKMSYSSTGANSILLGLHEIRDDDEISFSNSTLNTNYKYNIRKLIRVDDNSFILIHFYSEATTTSNYGISYYTADYSSGITLKYNLFSSISPDVVTGIKNAFFINDNTLMVISTEENFENAKYAFFEITNFGINISTYPSDLSIHDINGNMLSSSNIKTISKVGENTIVATISNNDYIYSVDMNLDMSSNIPMLNVFQNAKPITDNNGVKLYSTSLNAYSYDDKNFIVYKTSDVYEYGLGGLLISGDITQYVKQYRNRVNGIALESGGDDVYIKCIKPFPIDDF